MRGTKYVLKKKKKRNMCGVKQRKSELMLRASIARGERKVGTGR